MMHEMQVNDISRFFLKNASRLAVITLFLLVSFSFLGIRALPQLRTQYSMSQFLPESHPLIQADNEIRSAYGIPEHQPFFILLELPTAKGDWFQRERVNALGALSLELQKISGVKKATSLGNVEGASSTADGITVGKLLELTPEPNWRARVLADPLLSPGIISKDGQSALVVVDTEVLNTEAMQQLLEQARTLAEKKFPEAQTKLGGTSAIQSEMNQVLSLELKNFLLLSLLASLITLLSFFRNLSSVAIPILIMVIANIAAFAWMALAGVAFTVLSTTLPILVSITVISMATHTMLRYASDWQKAKRHFENPNKLRVLYQSFYALLLPNFLTAVTTSVGFLAIAFTKIPLIRQYGITVGISVFIAWIAIMLALPPLLILFPVPAVRSWTEQPARWALYVLKHKRLVVISLCALSVAFLWQGRNLNWSPQLFDDLPKDREARLTTEIIDKHLGGMIPLELVLTIPGEENPWNDPGRLARLDQLENTWRKDAAVGSVQGLVDLMRAVARINGKELPETRQAAAEYGFLYSFGESNILTSFLNPEGSMARIALRLHDIPAEEMEVLKKRVKAEALIAFPEAQVRLAGMATTVHVLNNELSADLIYGFWQALGIITLLLLVIFRSWRWTLFAVLANLVSPALLLGALAFSHTPIKPGIALIFSIALGIAFDNTVYLLGRLRYLMDRGASGFPVGKAWYQEGNLCLLSSLALSAGFFVFLGSYFSLNKLFGTYMLISMAGGLLGDLILLPAMLSLVGASLAKNKIQKEPEMKNLVSKNAIAAGLVALLCLAPTAAQALDLNNASEVLKAAEKNITSKDEIATLKMIITEASGAKKERGLEIHRKANEESQKVLVRMQSPADLKGTALLSLVEGKKTDQWLYLPSSKQTRRILSSKKSSNFMDSELSYEDMGNSSEQKSESKVLRQEDLAGKKFVVIECKKKEGDSSYSKILLWVSAEKLLVAKMEYYDQAEKLLKVTQFSGYKQFDHGVWRAQKVQVTNVQNKRGTILELSGLKLNTGLADAEFTEGALTDAE